MKTHVLTCNERYFSDRTLCWITGFLLVIVGNAWAGGNTSVQGNSWVSEWLKLQEMHANTSVRARIEIVNNYFNRIPRASDREVWGRKDYWATTEEFLQRAKGDCEDFAIAKYYTLRKLGIADQDLRLAYGKVLNPERGIEPHMVLLYLSPEGDVMVLDNVDARIHTLNERKDLILQYTFNSRWLWRWTAGNRQLLIGNADALPQWRSVQNKNIEPSGNLAVKKDKLKLAIDA